MKVVGAWMYSSIHLHLELVFKWEVNDQLHAPAALPFGKEHSFDRKEGGWAQRRSELW
jgi:hypothetical protein